MRGAVSLLMAVALLFMAGCGGPELYKTRGRILKGGQPYHPSGDDNVRVTLMPIPEGDAAVSNWYAANYDPSDGTFRAWGADGKGVPPGKYRIGVELLHDRNDVFKGKFFGDKSPFVREIRSSSDEITIDLDKPE